MNRRTTDILALGLLAVIIGNSAAIWIRGGIDPTLITTSCVGLLGLLSGARPWKRDDKDNKDEDKEP